MSTHLIFDSGHCQWLETPDEPCVEQLCALHAAAPALLRELIRLVGRCPGRMPDPRYGAWHDGCCDTARALIQRVQGEAEVAP